MYVAICSSMAICICRLSWTALRTMLDSTCMQHGNAPQPAAVLNAGSYLHVSHIHESNLPNMLGTNSCVPSMVYYQSLCVILSVCFLDCQVRSIQVFACRREVLRHSLRCRENRVLMPTCPAQLGRCFQLDSSASSGPVNSSCSKISFLVKSQHCCAQYGGVYEKSKEVAKLTTMHMHL